MIKYMSCLGKGICEIQIEMCGGRILGFRV